MANRDYTSAPISEQLGLPSIVAGLVADLDELRAGTISVNDAMARSMLAKQIFNGIRIYLNGTKLLSDQAALPQRMARSDEQTASESLREALKPPIKTGGGG